MMLTGILHCLNFLQLTHSQVHLIVHRIYSQEMPGRAALLSKGKGNCQSQGSWGQDCAPPLLGDRHLRLTSVRQMPLCHLPQTDATDRQMPHQQRSMEEEGLI